MVFKECNGTRIENIKVLAGAVVLLRAIHNVAHQLSVHNCSLIEHIGPILLAVEYSTKDLELENYI